MVSLLVYGLEQGQTADASSPNSPTSPKVSARKRQRWDPKPGQSWRLCAQSLPINLHIGWLSPLTYTFSEYYENNGKLYDTSSNSKEYAIVNNKVTITQTYLYQVYGANESKEK